MDSTADEDVVDDPAEPIQEDDRYGAIEVGNGDVVIYDRDNSRAWLQSDRSVSLHL